MKFETNVKLCEVLIFEVLLFLCPFWTVYSLFCVFVVVRPTLRLIGYAVKHGCDKK